MGTDCTDGSYLYSRLATDLRALVDLFTPEKVKEAVFSLGASKALGPNGFSFCFFHKYWDILQDDDAMVLL